MNSLKMVYELFLIIVHSLFICRGIEENLLELIFSKSITQSKSELAIFPKINRPTKLNSLNQKVPCDEHDLRNYRLIIEMKITQFNKIIQQPLLIFSNFKLPNISELDSQLSKHKSVGDLIFDKEAFSIHKDYQFISIPLERVDFNYNQAIGLYDIYESGETFSYQLNIWHDLDFQMCPRDCQQLFGYGKCGKGTCFCALEQFGTDCNVKVSEIIYNDRVKTQIASYSWKYFFVRIDSQIESISLVLGKTQQLPLSFSWLLYGKQDQVPSQEDNYQMIKPHTSESNSLLILDKKTIQEYFTIDNQLINKKGRLLLLGFNNLNERTIELLFSLEKSEIGEMSSESNFIFIICIIIGIIVGLIMMGGFIYYKMKQEYDMEDQQNRIQIERQQQEKSDKISQKISKKIINKFMPIYKYEKFIQQYQNLKIRECAICLTEFEIDDQVRLTQICFHVFHAQCLELWLEKHESCPLCRNPFDRQAIKEYLQSKKGKIENNLYIKNIMTSGNFQSKINAPSVIAHKEAGSSYQCETQVGIHSFNELVSNNISPFGLKRSSTTLQPTQSLDTCQQQIFTVQSDFNEDSQTNLQQIKNRRQNAEFINSISSPIIQKFNICDIKEDNKEQQTEINKVVEIQSTNLCAIADQNQQKDNKLTLDNIVNSLTQMNEDEINKLYPYNINSNEESNKASQIADKQILISQNSNKDPVSQEDNAILNDNQQFQQ